MPLFATPTHSIRGSPRGTNYRRLLRLALEMCDEFSLVRTRDELRPAGLEFEARLSRFKLRSMKSLEWPGTRIVAGESMQLSFYSLNEEAAAILAQAGGLYSFRAPHLPEDIAFYRQQAPWLWATAHERSAGMVLTDAEARRINREAPLLMVRRWKPKASDAQNSRR